MKFLVFHRLIRFRYLNVLVEPAINNAYGGEGGRLISNPVDREQVVCLFSVEYLITMSACYIGTISRFQPRERERERNQRYKCRKTSSPENGPSYLRIILFTDISNPFECRYTPLLFRFSPSSSAIPHSFWFSGNLLARIIINGIDTIR